MCACACACACVCVLDCLCARTWVNGCGGSLSGKVKVKRDLNGCEDGCMYVSAVTFCNESFA